MGCHNVMHGMRKHAISVSLGTHGSTTHTTKAALTKIWLDLDSICSLAIMYFGYHLNRIIRFVLHGVLEFGLLRQCHI